ncbi:hypothetical protein QZH41_007072 [Actinostola sp. cb2023]|nr:hypothetical protein QZH41_007072 [Actinostola sp. cb2023]
MAQMAPALTEANASPGSPRKNSVDRYCSSTVPEDLKQTTISKGVDLTLLSRNGLVRLLDGSDSSNNITNTTGEQSSCLSSPPKSSIRSEEDLTKTGMPNGHLHGYKENDVTMSKPANISTDSENRKPAILSQRACASSTATTLTTPAGACNIECNSEKNSRIKKHPVASFDSCKSLIPQMTARSVQRQARLENRARKLEKRLRRMQTRQIETHVHRQLNGIIDQLKGKTDLALDSMKVEENSLARVFKKKESLDSGKGSILSNACAIRSHEIDNGVIAFQAKETRNASSNSNPTENQFEHAVKYSPESVNKAIRNALCDERQKFETESLVEGLTAHVEHLEVMYDSDATEASSGNESEEEDQRCSV